VSRNGKATTFQRRRAACVETGNLTVADLSRWFGRPYATVRTWLYDGFEPSGGPRTRHRMGVRLNRLEAAVRRHGDELNDLPMGRRAERLAQLGGMP
jgi:hypothetical protein